MYDRGDFTGKVVRQLLYTPTAYQEVVKSYGTPKTIHKRLPPRICLRTFANRQLIGYALAFFIFAYALGWAPEILMLLLFCVFCAIVFVRASLETWRESKGTLRALDEDSFPSEN